jgi:hypothetical protein
MPIILSYLKRGLLFIEERRRRKGESLIGGGFVEEGV